MIALLGLWGVTTVGFAQPYCDEAQGTAGFPSNATCETSVCAADSYCCSGIWDSVCASEAAADPNCSTCLTSYVPPVPVYCDEPQGTAGFPSNATCEASVCAADSWCCSTSWDATCASEAAIDPNCSTCLTSYVPPVAYCDQAQGTAGFPSDATCEASVCAADSYCCSTSWDGVCASEAAADPNCTSCLVPNCDEAQGTAGFPSDATCEASVCAADSYCCSTSWDGVCASEAAADPNCASCLSAPVTAPANDECANAIGLVCGDLVSGTTTGATVDMEVDGITCGTTSVIAEGVWYTIYGTGLNVTASTCSFAGYDTKLFVFEGGCGTLTCVGGSDDVCGAQSEVTWLSSPGVQYSIFVSGYSGTGDFELGINCATPANDDCANAELLTVNVSCASVSGDVVGATQSQAGCAGTADDDVWYSFVAVTTEATVEVVGSASFDAVLEVFDGSCGSLNSLGCVDVTLNGGTESVNVTGLVPGNTYYARVYHWYASVAATTTFDICVYSLTVGIQDDLENGLSVYPNPSNGQFVVEVNGVDADAQIIVMDIAGRQVYTEGVTMNGSFRKELNLNVATGTYLLQIATVDGTVTRKIQIN